MENCIFCAIIARQAPAKIIAETDDLIVIEDRASKAPIHYLIIPKKHIKDITSFERSDCCYGSKMFFMAQQLSKEHTKTQDFKLLINNGYNAGQRVFHVHMHFLAGANMSE